MKPWDHSKIVDLELLIRPVSLRAHQTSRDQGPGTRGQGEAKRTLGRLPGEHLGASLVKEDFGGKTSKLAEAFDEK